jgi:membrane protease YdiL (CAAX protease family)
MPTEFKLMVLKILPFLIMLLAFWIAIKRKRLNFIDLCIQAPVSYRKFFIWCSLYLMFILVTELTLFKTGLLEVNHRNYALLPSIIRITGIIVLAPVSEELLFRGLLVFKLLQWKLGKHSAILIQAVIFVLLHSFTYKNTIASNIGIIQVFLDACLFAYARFSTQSIYTSMVMHSTGNLIAVLEQFII